MSFESMPPKRSTNRSWRIGDWCVEVPLHRRLVAPLLFYCAETVSEPHLFHPWNLQFERKQIPQFVVNVRISRKAMEPLEATRLPCSQAGDRLASLRYETGRLT